MIGSINQSNYILNRTVAPTDYPVTLDDVKQNCGVEYNEHDVLLQSLIESATSQIEEMLGLYLITQTWTVSIQATENNRLLLPLLPVQSVSALNYYDTDDADQTLTVSDFYLYKSDNWAFLEPKTGTSWPATTSRLDALTATVVCGFGNNGASVPANIKQAVLMLVAHWYENRAAKSDIQLYDVPFAVELIISTARRGWVA